MKPTYIHNKNTNEVKVALNVTLYMETSNQRNILSKLELMVS
jgi:hypothetical protein